MDDCLCCVPQHQAVSDGGFEPGSSPVVPFTVSTNGTGGDFVIQATNNQGFRSSSPPSLFVETGGSANGTVTLTVPADTPSGSDVTLTIEAQAPGTVDTNYAVLRLSITRQVTHQRHRKSLKVKFFSPKQSSHKVRMWVR